MGIPPGGPRPVGLRSYRFVMSDRGYKRAQYKLERSGLKIGPTLSGPRDTNTEKQVVWPPALFDNFVGNQKKVAANGQTKRLGRLQVYHQLEFGWLLHGQFGRLCPLENLVQINGGRAGQIGQVYAVGDEAPDFHTLPRRIH